MSILDFLTAGSGAYKAGRDYDEQQQQDAMRQLALKQQQIEMIDRLGMMRADPLTPTSGLDAAMKNRPDGTAASVGLTPSAIDPIKALVPQMHTSTPTFGAGEMNAPAAVAPTLSAPHAPPNPMAALIASKSMQATAPLTTRDDGSRALAMRQVAAPRTTLPDPMTGETQDFTMYPGGAMKRQEDLYAARNIEQEHRDQGRIQQQMQAKQAIVAAENQKYFATVKTLANHTQDPMLLALINNADDPSTAPEGQWKSALDLWKSQSHEKNMAAMQSTNADRQDARTQVRIDNASQSAKHEGDLYGAEVWFRDVPNEPEMMRRQQLYKSMSEASPNIPAREIMLAIQKGTGVGLGQDKARAQTANTQAGAGAKEMQNTLMGNATVGTRSGIAPAPALHAMTPAEIKAALIAKYGEAQARVLGPEYFQK